MARRRFFSQLAALPFLAAGSMSAASERKTLKIMMKSPWGSDDPTKATFPFLHGLALAEAGYEVQIYGAKFGNPTIFVSLVEWADKIISE